MAVQIDERAIVGKNVELGDNVQISPYAVLEDNIKIGAGTIIGAHAYIGSNTTIGDDCRIFNGASVGTIAQDLKYKDEDAYLIVGDRTQIREFCTLNKGTAENNGVTKVGSDCALLAYCHIAHDCIVGDHFVSSNALTMAGHVKIGDHVTCGGKVSIHQFTQVGDQCFLGANTFVKMDAVPFSLVSGDSNSASIYGINKVGLERRGFTKEDMSAIKMAYKFIFRKKLSLEDAKAQIIEKWPDNEHIANLLAFCERSNRGLIRMGK